MSPLIPAGDPSHLGGHTLLWFTLLGAMSTRAAIPVSPEKDRLMDVVDSCRRGLFRTLYEVKLWRKEITARALRGTVPAAPRLPDFVVIGAQRAGTTSLWENVGRHPGVSLPARKELHFFDFNFQRGISWYRAQFRNCVTPQGIPLVGDASPYYLFHPHVPSRCSALL